jgi:HK97 gp10 family phage protein
MAYRFRGRGQFTSATSRSGHAFVHDTRRVLISGDNFKLTWNGPTIVAEILAALNNALSELSNEALDYMQSIVPVDTGATRDSCFATVVGQGERVALVIGAGTPYAIYIELGTSSHAARPFIRPTFDFIIQQLPALVKSEVASRAR